MNTEIITTENQGELLSEVENDFEMLRERIEKFYPDMQQVFPIARFISNVGLFKPVRTFNSFSTREELSKSVTTIGPYNYLNYNNVKITSCDLSFEYDFDVFWFLICMVFKTGSTKLSFSTSNFMFFKDKNTKNSNNVEADKLYKSLERHYTIDVQYDQKNINVSSRFLSSLKRVGKFEFELEIVASFFDIYSTDGGYIVGFQREHVKGYKQELAKKIHFFLSGSKFTGALKCAYVGFCHSMGFALNGNKLDKLSKSRLKQALESCIDNGILKSYTIEEERDADNKKYPTAFVFYVGSSKENTDKLEKKVEKKNDAEVEKKNDVVTDTSSFDDEFADFYDDVGIVNSKLERPIENTDDIDEFDDFPTDFLDKK
ncbi:hypothetical protein [Pseudomonas extremaustralis]